MIGASWRPLLRADIDLCVSPIKSPGQPQRLLPIWLPQDTWQDGDDAGDGADDDDDSDDDDDDDDAAYDDDDDDGWMGEDYHILQLFLLKKRGLKSEQHSSMQSTEQQV